MQKYTCNNCGNTFLLGSPVQLNCPACGSNSISEIGEQTRKTVWQNKIVIFSFVALFLMLIILFLLPRSSSRYDVWLEKFPEKCTFKIVIKDGNRIASADNFKYSANNGKTWQLKNEFTAEYIGAFMVRVMHKEDTGKIFLYKFNNPFSFNPTCKNLVEEPCDCKKLQILSIENKEISNRGVLIIHASQPQCPKEYSITGLNGEFQADSVFPINKMTDFTIFVRSAKCEPVAYAMNSYHVAPASLKKVSTVELNQKMNRFIKTPDNKLMYEICNMFESYSVRVNVNNSTQNQPTIYEYLQRLKTLGSTNEVVIKVINARSNSSNKINQLSLLETQQNE